MILSIRRRTVSRALAFSAVFLLGTHLQAQTGGRTGGTGTGATGNRAGTGATNRGATTTRNTSSSSSSGSSQYRSNTQLGNATIEVDPETRSLVIVTDEETNGELSKVIKNLDQPKPQVLIKVVFAEITYNNSSDVGLEGSYTFNVGNPATPASTNTTNTTTTNNGTTASGGTSTTTTTNNSTATTAATLASGVSSVFGLSSATTGTFVRVLADDYSATLHLLETKGKVEILSRPSIMARNNQEAVIVVGSEVPFVTSSLISDTGQVTNNITYDNVGIILRVTPFITSEHSVEMIVAPEISALTDQTVPISSSASAPVISKRSAETVVVTPNAKTVVIGGMLQTQRTSSVQKVPLLGDIPYLGYAFRRTVKSEQKQELMIFLTPYIVSSDGRLQELTGTEIANTDNIKHSFTDRDLQYIDRQYGEQEPLPTLPYTDGKEIRAAVPVIQTQTTTTTVKTTKTPVVKGQATTKSTTTRGTVIKKTTKTAKPSPNDPNPPVGPITPSNIVSPPTPSGPMTTTLSNQSDQ